MDFITLKTELSDRGFAHLSATRRGRYINQARAELDDMFLWPYRETSASGAAPLTVADLGWIEGVVNQAEDDTEIKPASREALVARYGDLTTTGAPQFYYVAWSGGSPVVNVYPVRADTITVRYWKVTADLSADGDTPLAPARFHRLIVDIAQRDATADLRGDNAEVLAERIQGRIDRKVARMVDALFGQAPAPRYVFVTGGEGY